MTSGNAGQRSGSDQKGPEAYRELRSETAHRIDVMLVMQAEDHGAGGEEEQRLEEGMGHEVEYRRRPGSDPEGQKHVADLADRGVRQHAFEVALYQARCKRPAAA